MPCSILIFVPTYNERDNVESIASQLLALELDADLLFLDDNSPDGTGDVLDRLAAGNPRIRVIHRPGKLGVGSAHQEGIAWAYDRGYETLVTMDCDFTHNPADLRRMIAASAGFDVTVGSRYLQPGSLPGWNPLRRLLTNFGHFLTKRLLGMEYDATGAYRVYRLGRVSREIFALVTSRGYAFFFESLFLLHRNGVSIGQVPIILPARTYGTSKMSFLEPYRSLKQVVALSLATMLNPGQFRIIEPLEGIDPDLVDPQGWDPYWDRKRRKSAFAYEVVATLYRDLVIRRRLESVIRGQFPDGSSLLHAGCGSGQVDRRLSERMKITAVDISVSALRLYRQNNPRAFRVTHASVLSLPLGDASFDGSYNLGLLEHFSAGEIRRILAELARVVRPGGKIVVFWPHAHATSVFVLSWIHWLLNDVLKKNVELHPPEISLLKSRHEAESLFRAVGLEPIAYRFGAGDFWVQAVLVARKPLAVEGPS